jgi:hypothetical protein
VKVKVPLSILSPNLTQSSPDRRGEDQGGYKKLKGLVPLVEGDVRRTGGALFPSPIWRGVRGEVLKGIRGIFPI